MHKNTCQKTRIKAWDTCFKRCQSLSSYISYNKVLIVIFQFYTYSIESQMKAFALCWELWLHLWPTFNDPQVAFKVNQVFGIQQLLPPGCTLFPAWLPSVRQSAMTTSEAVRSNSRISISFSSSDRSFSNSSSRIISFYLHASRCQGLNAFTSPFSTQNRPHLTFIGNGNHLLPPDHISHGVPMQLLFPCPQTQRHIYEREYESWKDLCYWLTTAKKKWWVRKPMEQPDTST